MEPIAQRRPGASSGRQFSLSLLQGGSGTPPGTCPKRAARFAGN